MIAVLDVRPTVSLKRVTQLLLLCVALFSSTVALTQNTQNDGVLPTHEPLVRVQAALARKIEERNQLRSQLKIAEKDEQPDLEAQVQAISAEIKSLRSTFEQLAVGSVELDVFSEAPTEFDWRKEVTQILMPVMENLKALTEKPRKIEGLRSLIEKKQDQRSASEVAIQAIEQRVANVQDEPTNVMLRDLLNSWTARQETITRDIDLARTQLDGLQYSSESWWDSIKSSFKELMLGRGLTILIAAVAATFVWYFMRLILALFEKFAQSRNRKTFRTRQRLARYASKILTGVLILVAMMMVFYFRGDMLLMAVSFLVMAAIILGLRNALPKFLAEMRLLLNIGSIREDERVMFNGLPWQVVSLNVFSVLRNPELTGVIRLPLESLSGMISRPAGNEHWFPTSKGDYIVMPDEKLLKVVSQTPERVELENLVGTVTTIPSGEFYSMTFENLSRGENYAVVGVFGVDYNHQSISMSTIPQKLHKAIHDELANSDLADSVENIAVELKEAGASSLDFWICVSMKSSAARAYNRLNRLIQQVCVTTCTEQNWGIPFPQLTLHQVG